MMLILGYLLLLGWALCGCRLGGWLESQLGEQPNDNQQSLAD